MKLHSMSDIITNSSEIIYTIPSSSAVDTLRNIVDEILKDAGIDKKWDDLYVIKETLDRKALFQECSFHDDSEITEESTDEEIIKAIREGFYESRWMWDYVHLEMWAIDGDKTNLPNKMSNLFYIEASYNG